MKAITFNNTILGILGVALLLCLLTFSACSRKVNSTSTKTYLPPFLKEVTLGQDQATVLKMRPAAHVVNTLLPTQWQQFTEDLSIDNFISVYYDFEKTGAKQLVSIALLHKDEGSAAATFKGFGGTASEDNLNERMRSAGGDNKIYAAKKGRRVTIYLPIALQKNTPSFNQ